MQSNKDSWLSLIQNGYVQAIVILLTLVLFLLTKNVLFGILIAMEIFGILVLEVITGIKKNGLLNELKDTFIALAVALGVWFLATLLLNTSSPISAVASCSMLPHLDRGDFVIVQGSEIAVQEINLTKKEFEEILGQAVVGNKSFLGSLYSYCVQVKDPYCDEFILNPSLFQERRGPLTFHYAKCEVTISGEKTYEPCVSHVEFKGKNYSLLHSSDIIVYQPTSKELYSKIGDIVHRAQLKLNVEGKYYYLTKGDNNPIFDIQVFNYEYQMGNNPVPSENVKGKVIFRVPCLGYLKLFISGLFAEPSQCRIQLGNPILEN